jgi:hypothetical protein
LLFISEILPSADRIKVNGGGANLLAGRPSARDADAVALSPRGCPMIRNALVLLLAVAVGCAGKTAAPASTPAEEISAPDLWRLGVNAKGKKVRIRGQFDVTASPKDDKGKAGFSLAFSQDGNQILKGSVEGDRVGALDKKRDRSGPFLAQLVIEGTVEGVGLDGEIRFGDDLRVLDVVD